MIIVKNCATTVRLGSDKQKQSFPQGFLLQRRNLWTKMDSHSSNDQFFHRLPSFPRPILDTSTRNLPLCQQEQKTWSQT